MLHDGRSGRLQLIDTSARWSFLTASVREPPVRNCWAGACTLEASKRATTAAMTALGSMLELMFLFSVSFRSWPS